MPGQKGNKAEAALNGTKVWQLDLTGYYACCANQRGAEISLHKRHLNALELLADAQHSVTVRQRAMANDNSTNDEYEKSCVVTDDALQMTADEEIVSAWVDNSPGGGTDHRQQAGFGGFGARHVRTAGYGSSEDSEGDSEGEAPGISHISKLFMRRAASRATSPHPGRWRLSRSLDCENGLFMPQPHWSGREGPTYMAPTARSLMHQITVSRDEMAAGSVRSILKHNGEVRRAFADSSHGSQQEEQQQQGPDAQGSQRRAASAFRARFADVPPDAGSGNDVQGESRRSSRSRAGSGASGGGGDGAESVGDGGSPQRANVRSKSTSDAQRNRSSASAECGPHRCKSLSSLSAEESYRSACECRSSCGNGTPSARVGASTGSSQGAGQQWDGKQQEQQAARPATPAAPDPNLAPRPSPRPPHLARPITPEQALLLATVLAERITGAPATPNAPDARTGGRRASDADNRQYHGTRGTRPATLSPSPPSTHQHHQPPTRPKSPCAAFPVGRDRSGGSVEAWCRPAAAAGAGAPAVRARRASMTLIPEHSCSAWAGIGAAAEPAAAAPAAAAAPRPRLARHSLPISLGGASTVEDPVERPPLPSISHPRQQHQHVPLPLHPLTPQENQRRVAYADAGAAGSPAAHVPPLSPPSHPMQPPSPQQHHQHQYVLSRPRTSHTPASGPGPTAAGHSTSVASTGHCVPAAPVRSPSPIAGGTLPVAASHHPARGSAVHTAHAW